MASLVDSSQKPNSIVITPSAIEEAVLKLRKKKFAAGADSICAEHFIAASDVLYDLCIGVISPILKKIKPKSSCSSYRPVTVSSVSTAIFELPVGYRLLPCP